jgi:hypothetical protein
VTWFTDRIATGRRRLCPYEVGPVEPRPATGSEEVAVRVRSIAGAVVASVLAVDGGAHTFWAVSGSSWPAHDHRALSAGLLDMQVPFTPRVLVPLAVLLFGGAALVAARAGLLGAAGRRLPRWLPYLATLAVTGGTAVRAVAGFGWLVTADPASTFFRLNLAVYTPLCLLLAAAGLVLLRRERPGSVASTPGWAPSR